MDYSPTLLIVQILKTVVSYIFFPQYSNYLSEK